MGKLFCSKCELEKEQTEFSRARSSTRGYAYWCKSCMKIYMNSPDQKNKTREYYKREDVIERMREYRSQPTYKEKKKADNKRRYKNGGYERHRVYYLRNRNKILAKQKTPEARLSQKYKKLKYKYGITKQQYKNLCDSQNGRCAICEKELDMAKNTCIDHDHKTGKIRGILCSNCNRGLGGFMDNQEFTRSATEYLIKYKKVL